MFSFKNIFFCLAISIGVLAGVLTAIIYLLAMNPDIDGIFHSSITAMVPPAFISWALYFAHGQGNTSFWKTGLCNSIGVIVGSLIVIIAGLLGGIVAGNAVWGNIALGIAVILGGGWMTLEATFKVVDYVPAAFCGCATAFALGALFNPLAAGADFLPVIQVILAFWIGLVCAWLSDKWGGVMLKKDA
jgi:hypothetical protein